MMKNRFLITLLFITGVLSLTTVSAASFVKFEGEKLISFSMDLEKWERHNKDLLKSKSLVWFKKELRKEGRPFDDFYMVNIYNQSKNGLNHMRDRYDKPGRKFCDSFESIDLATDEQHYESMSWRTECLKNRAPEARIIHLVLLGKRHIYHIQKGWSGKVEQSEINMWLDRIKRIHLCDINNPEAPCPAAPIAQADVTVQTQEIQTLAIAVNSE
jgi:hypothetical protein